MQNNERLEEGQRVEIGQMIEGEPPVPPGAYTIVEIKSSLTGGNTYRLRSVPDEDVDAEVDEDDLLEAMSDG